MAPGRHLRRGGTADLFLLDERRVLKLYFAGCQRGHVEREARAARAAHAAGVRTPAVLDVVEIESRPGVIFERAEGPTMLEALAAQPEQRDGLAAQLAQIQAGVHSCPVDDLPEQRERLRRQILRAPGLDEPTRSAVLADLERLPVGTALCHGDCQPGNVILAEAGPTLIDWFDAASGDPVADVVRTVLLIRLAGSATAAPEIAPLRAGFGAAFLRRYAELRPASADAMAAWAPVLAAARLAEPVGTAERAALIDVIRNPATFRDFV